MTTKSSNELGKRIKDVRELQAVEEMLLVGTTINELAASLQVSKGQARRLVAAMRTLGCTVKDNYVPGTLQPATYKMTASSRLFKKTSRNLSNPTE